MGLRCEEPGWRRIGVMCSSNRRALWYRLIHVNVPFSERQEHDQFQFADATETDINVIRPTAVELCAGREGDDAFVRVEADNPVFVGLLDCLEYALFAASDAYENEAREAADDVLTLAVDDVDLENEWIAAAGDPACFAAHKHVLAKMLETRRMLWQERARARLKLRYEQRLADDIAWYHANRG